MLRKARVFFRLSVLMFIGAVVFAAATGFRSLPDRLFVMFGDEAVAVAGSLDIPVFDGDGADYSGGYEIYTSDMTLSLFGVPLKNVSVNVLPDVEVVPCGLTVGITIETTGLMVLGTGSVTSKDGVTGRPCDGKVKAGDLLLKVDGKEIADHKQFITYIESLPPGGSVSLTLSRAGQTSVVSVTCSVSADDGKNKLGLWIRDSTKGIGTITYYDPSNMRFAALGHGVVDVDTKQIIPVKDGKVYEVNIVGTKKGRKGSPGELVGEVNRSATIGKVTGNSHVGLFGTIDADIAGLPAKTMKIALQNDVHEGPAVILSNISGKDIRQYDIYIERINRYTGDDSKCMVIRITDQELLTRTNGIVQGMSGCPIIQDGRLIGAVTHVFVQNPQKGYGIFIENMLAQSRP